MCPTRSLFALAGRAIESALGKLHNNAGVGMHGTPAEQVKPEEWDWVIGVNIMGVINGIGIFVPMTRSHGEVVNTHPGSPARRR